VFLEKKVNVMSRLLATKACSKRANTSSLAALSSPKQWLDFALNNELSAEEAREVAFAFLRKFGQFIPEKFSFSNIQAGSPGAKEELIALIASAANNFER
jgi:hypothetical protein